MEKILIIADDLTGAADCGVVFAECGMEAVVVLDRPGDGAMERNPPDSAGALAIDADTRRLGPEQAAAIVARIVEWYGGSNWNRGLLFKKVDSTLRGNVASELAAALKTRRALASPSQRVTILFAPAFPAHGRTTVKGCQRVNGEPLGGGSRTPIEAMLLEAGLSSRMIGLAEIRAGAGALEHAMRSTAADVDVLACDAETEDDLQGIANAGMMLGPQTVWAGSAGLGRHLANALRRASTNGSAAMFLRDVGRPGPTLFAVGSPSAVSREQARVLSTKTGIEYFRFAAKEILSARQSNELQRLADNIMEHLAAGEDVLLQVDSPDRCTTEQGRMLARSLGRTLETCARHVGALVATGGETARSILDAWDICRMRLVGEVEPGLPYSVAECASRRVLILTKAGGFGTPDTLLRCREFLQSLRSPDTGETPAAMKVES